MSRVFVIAGEESGDALGAPLMAALKRTENGKALQFIGIGGQNMAAQGLNSLFPMTELSVMGLAEVLPRIPKLLGRIRQTADAIVRDRPDVVITIDAPDFCFRVARRVKAAAPDIPIVHMVAPTVWAWRPGRAAKVARFLDHMLCLLPFEPSYFEREGLAATFIGHPVVQSEISGDAPDVFRTRHGIPADAPLLAVLPGSRRGEVSRLLGVFSETVARVAEDIDGLHAVVVTLGSVAETVRAAAKDWPIPAVVVDSHADGGSEKRAAFGASTAALAASGTVSVELATAGCPHVIAYRVHPLTAMIARRLVRVEYASLVNLIAGRAVIPEFIQDSCEANTLSQALVPLLRGDNAESQRTAFEDALTAMGRGGPPPADRAAAVIETYLSAAAP